MTYVLYALQELIVLRAIRDANVPKFLQDDLKLFNGIVSDLFPRIKEEPMDYGEMEASIKKTCIDKGLEDVEGMSNMRARHKLRPLQYLGILMDEIMKSLCMYMYNV